jgi:hypothetical protein
MPLILSITGDPVMSNTTLRIEQLNVPTTNLSSQEVLKPIFVSSAVTSAITLRPQVGYIVVPSQLEAYQMVKFIPPSAPPTGTSGYVIFTEDVPVVSGGHVTDTTRLAPTDNSSTDILESRTWSDIFAGKGVSEDTGTDKQKEQESNLHNVAHKAMKNE